jgi:hypothetical protein
MEVKSVNMSESINHVRIIRRIPVMTLREMVDPEKKEREQGSSSGRRILEETGTSSRKDDDKDTPPIKRRKTTVPLKKVPGVPGPPVLPVRIAALRQDRGEANKRRCTVREENALEALARQAQANQAEEREKETGDSTKKEDDNNTTPVKRRKTTLPKKIPVMPLSISAAAIVQKYVERGKGLRPIAFMKYFVEHISTNDNIMRYIIGVPEARAKLLEICPEEIRDAVDAGLDDLINVNQVEAECVKSHFNKQSCVELLRIPDPAFQKLMIKHGKTLNIEQLGNLIEAACEGNLGGKIRTKENFKFIMISRHGLMFKLLDSKVTLRAILEPFGKMASIGTEPIVEGILLPFLKDGHKFAHGLLCMLDGDYCFERILKWAKEKDLTMEDHFAQILMDIMSGDRFMVNPMQNDDLLNLIEASFLRTPADVKNAKFAMFVFDRYKSVMSDDMLKRCFAVNEAQRTVLRTRIKNILEEEERNRKFKSFHKIRI